MQVTQESWGQSLGCEDPPKEDIATYSSILAWRIPWTEEPGSLIFKSRDITLPIKVRLVKAMVFPVVMYGCLGEVLPPVYPKSSLLQCGLTSG